MSFIKDKSQIVNQRQRALADHIAGLRQVFAEHKTFKGLLLKYFEHLNRAHSLFDKMVVTGGKVDLEKEIQKEVKNAEELVDTMEKEFGNEYDDFKKLK